MTDRHSRRTVLRRGAIAGLASAGSLAGCQFLGGRSPATTVEEFYGALDSGATGRARGKYAGGPARDHFPPYFGDGFDDYEITVDSAETIEDSDGVASVETTTTVAFPVFGERTVSGTIEVRREDGTRVWRIPETLPLGTEVQFELPVNRNRRWDLTWFDDDDGSRVEIGRMSGNQNHPLDGSQLLLTIEGASTEWVNDRYRWTDLGGPASIVTGDLVLDRDALRAAGKTMAGAFDVSGATIRLSYVVAATHRPFQINEWDDLDAHRFEPP